ncbi:MAG TPA: serine hydrolase [Patescibacteria group bacterium]|nr:serine hydrolase [Patescibacteria group bacterium]
MTKSFPFLLIFFLTFSLVVPKPAAALTQTERSLLLQQIEILKHEIQVFQSLLLNLQLKQEVSAASYIVVNLSDNSVILTKNADQIYPIASVTKLMNAVIASEQIEKDQTIQLTEKMLEPLGSSPSIFSGLKISAENLLKASLIQSTNDAAEALSYFSGKDKFLDLMNQKAKELDMENTSFSDTHGLSTANRSTASDLAKLVAYIHQEHPEIWQITKTNDFWLPDASGWLFKFQNVNNFYLLNEFIGGKTGYLPQAKQTLASIFRVNEKPLAIILLYSDNRQADVFTLLNRLKK